MRRSSSLAITIVHPATAAPADLDELRVLIHAAIDAVNHQTGLETGLDRATDPSGPAAEVRKPDGPGDPS